MRLRRVAGTKERLLHYDNLVVFRPAEQKGRWRQCFGNENPLCLEIGCGRGKFIVNSAKEFPEKNFIGLELREEMIMDSIDRLNGDYPVNMKFIWENANLLPEVFAEGEVDTIYLNFFREIIAIFYHYCFYKFCLCLVCTYLHIIHYFYFT